MQTFDNIGYQELNKQNDIKGGNHSEMSHAYYLRHR
jgi:hypothetical protein